MGFELYLLNFEITLLLCNIKNGINVGKLKLTKLEYAVLHKHKKQCNQTNNIESKQSY